jgi:hypothetical protein
VFEREYSRFYVRLYAAFVRGVRTWALISPPQYVHRQADRQTGSVRAVYVHRTYTDCPSVNATYMQANAGWYAHSFVVATYTVATYKPII